MRDRPRANTAPPARSPCRGDRFPRSMQEPRPRSRHLHAGHHLANQQAPARLIPGLQSIPGFGINLFLRHVISGSLALAFVIHTCRAHGATFPPTLTTTALHRSSSGWFAASAYTAAAEGHQDTNARLLHLLHSTASSDSISYIQPPSTFVAHLGTNPRPQSPRIALTRHCCSCRRAERSGCGRCGLGIARRARVVAEAPRKPADARSREGSARTKWPPRR